MQICRRGVVVALVVNLALSCTQVSSMRRCKSSRDCGVGECCTVAKMKTIQICNQNAQLGDVCSLFRRPGPVLPRQCPCDLGLTCAPPSTQGTTGKSLHKSKCIPVPRVEDEAHEMPAQEA